MLVLYVPFLVFLCFLVIVSLFKLEKIIMFKYYHTVLKVVLEGLNFFHSQHPLFCFKSFLISFLLFCFYYTIMKLIMKVKLFSVLIFLRHQTLFFIHFNILAVYLLYRIRLTWLSIDIELNSGPKQSSFKYFSTCLRNSNSIPLHDFLRRKTFNCK